MKQNSYFLPKEIWCTVFSNLNLASLTKTSLVNKDWLKLSQAEQKKKLKDVVFYTVGKAAFRKSDFISDGITKDDFTYSFNELEKCHLFLTKKDAQQFVDTVYQCEELFPAIFTVRLKEVNYNPIFTCKFFRVYMGPEYFRDYPEPFIYKANCASFDRSKLQLVQGKAAIGLRSHSFVADYEAEAKQARPITKPF